MTNVRLQPSEVKIICGCIQKRDPEAIIYLYGSRVNQNLKGGDIDLYVLSETLTFADKIDIINDIQNSIGEQKIDLTIKNQLTASEDPFFQNIGKVALS